MSKRFLWVVELMVVSFLGGSWLAPRIRVVWEPGELPDQAFAQAKPSPNPPINAEEPVAKAVAIISPSVVNIDTVRRVVTRDWFYGPQVQQSSGAGSGVVIDSKGLVLTNQHVVEGADQIQVTFGNGRRYPGHVVGGDKETDVAVVQIDKAPTLPAARLGDARNLVPGQWAIARGNPYGVQHTVTLGVVGHTGRALETEDRLYKTLIQTDAAINPGNSGGPLCDIHGSVIGINTVIRADAQGLGFAIPIDVAKSIADELQKFGKIKRPWIGLISKDLDEETARYLGAAEGSGVYVEILSRRGPAFRAGVRPGDVIRSINGRTVRTRQQVEDLVAGLKIGQKIEIVVEREGQRFKGEIEVVEKP